MKAYLSPDGTLKGDTQTAYLLALRFDVVPQEMRSKVAEKLYARIAARDGHLGTGFLGVNILLPTLTDLGRNDLAYQLVTKTTYPSWGYSIVNGATTIWERWNSYTKEKGFGDVGMNSFNHYAYGSAVEWLYTTVLGIDAMEPGFAKHPHRAAAGRAALVGARALRLAARTDRQRLAHRRRAADARRHGPAQHHGGSRRAGEER